MSSTIFALGVGVIIGLSISTIYSQENRQIVKHGCAEYNSTTGNLQWKDK